ncbi:MAG: polysaccharide biosynthesis tyrosine autokinase [Roseiflexaceae bacterium]
MDLKVYTAFVWRWAWLIGLMATLLALVALIYSLRQTPLYASTTTLLVSQSGPNRNTPDFETLRTRERLAKTYAELLVKRPVLQAAIETTGVEMSLGDLLGRVSVTLIQDTELMRLTVRDTDPTRAALLANTIGQIFPSVYDQINPSISAQAQPTLLVVEEARPSSSPVSPNTSRNILLAAVIGIFLACAGGFFYDYFNDKVGSAKRIEQLSGLETLTVIAPITAQDPADMRILPGKASLAVAEAYRMVRGSLVDLQGQAIQSLAITSALPKEGRSITAANLAIAMAQTGKRVILVDADLRRPSQQRFFRSTNTRGLSSLLLKHGGEQISDHLLATDVEQLQLLPSGPMLPNAIGQLGTPRLLEVLNQLKQHADLVIFDTPSLMSVVDGQLIASICDAAVVVVRPSVSREQPLQQAIARLLDLNIPILGTVLNEAEMGQAYAEYYSGASVAESLTVIDFVRAVGGRLGDRNANRKEK